MLKQKAHIGTLVDSSKFLIHEDLLERFSAALYNRTEAEGKTLPAQALATFGAHDKAYKLLGIKQKNVF